ncbi:MAG: Tyrosine recombinase XerD [Candidatus Hinthialibacteria bacterium OLB16]|nr:MAG: Tyrosine recombinase XerD [Candidatus Hinthialibacteria bacterium OLB16]
MRRDTAIQSFLDYLVTERGLGLRTCQAYGSDLQKVATHFFGEDSPARWQDLSTEHLIAYLDEQRKAGQKPSSIARCLASLRGFYRFLVDEGVVGKDITSDLQNPRVRRPLPQTFSENDVIRLIEAPDCETPSGLRDRALLELLYASGLRISEACGLRPDSVHWAGDYLVVMGKGKKSASFPFTSAPKRRFRNTFKMEGPPLILKIAAPPFCRHPREAPLEEDCIPAFEDLCVAVWPAAPSITS